MAVLIFELFKYFKPFWTQIWLLLPNAVHLSLLWDGVSCLNSTCKQSRGFEGVLSVMLRYNAETGNPIYYSVGWHWSYSYSETVQVRTC